MCCSMYSWSQVLERAQRIARPSVAPRPAADRLAHDMERRRRPARVTTGNSTRSSPCNTSTWARRTPDEVCESLRPKATIAPLGERIGTGQDRETLSALMTPDCLMSGSRPYRLWVDAHSTHGRVLYALSASDVLAKLHEIHAGEAIRAAHRSGLPLEVARHVQYARFSMSSSLAHALLESLVSQLGSVSPSRWYARHTPSPHASERVSSTTCES